MQRALVFRFHYTLRLSRGTKWVRAHPVPTCRVGWRAQSTRRKPLKLGLRCRGTGPVGLIKVLHIIALKSVGVVHSRKLRARLLVAGRGCRPGHARARSAWYAQSRRHHGPLREENDHNTSMMPADKVCANVRVPPVLPYESGARAERCVHSTAWERRDAKEMPFFFFFPHAQPKGT